MKTDNLLRDIREFLAIISTKIDIDNSSGYFDSNKFSEKLFKPIFGRIFGKEFKQSKKINHPAIDLFSLDDEIAIQISSECSVKKIRQTLDEFLHHNLHKRYTKLYIFFLKTYCPSKKSIDRILNNPKYDDLVKHNIFEANNLLDPKRLYKFIEDCSPSVIEGIYVYLSNEFSSNKVVDDVLRIDIPPCIAVENYIERHLTHDNLHDYWAFYFGKETLFKIFKDKLENNKSIRIILKAEAGQGKSVELDNIAYQIQNSKLELYPLRLTIKNYTSHLDEFISRKYPFWRQVNKGQIVLLVDGLDEINQAVYQTFVSEFNHIIDSEPELKIICTIRSNFNSEVYSGNNEGFEIFYIDRLFQNDIDQYIENHSRQPDTIKALAGKHWVKNIIYIPFYLSELIKLSNEDRQELPNNLDDLYKKIIERRLSQDLTKYNGALNKQSMYNVMQKVAIYMTLRGENTVGLSKVSQLTTQDEHHILANSFLSTNDEGMETSVSFIHNNFQEYLGAKRLSKLNWSEIEKILFNAEGNFLNVKLLNTTILLFSIIPRGDIKYELLTNAINENDYTILFQFEKERIPLRDRLDLFRKFILEGKRKKIAYLSGNFNAYMLVDFIEGDMEGLEFLIQEINDNPVSSNHFQSLLYFVYEYCIRQMPKRKKIKVFEILKDLITKPGFKETEYREMIDIIQKLGFFTEQLLNTTIKKCPSIHYAYVLTRVIDLIQENGIPNQFEFVLQNAKHLNLRDGISTSDHKRVFGRYVIKNICFENYTALLHGLSDVQNFYVNHLLMENDYSEENGQTYLDKVYLKFAQLYNQANDNRIVLNFISYLNEVNYDSHSQTTYGNAVEFFKNIEQKDLLEWLLRSDPLLQSGHIFDLVFNLNNVDHSNMILALYKEGKIGDDRVKQLYYITFSNLSKTSMSLCEYFCKKFPTEFRPFITRSAIEERNMLWKEMDAKLLNDKNLFAETVGKIVMHIKSNRPQLISESETIDIGHEYGRELKEKFECNVAVDFLDWNCRNKSVKEYLSHITDDKNWFVYVSKMIIMHKHDESIKSLLIPAKTFLQNFVNSIVPSMVYTSFDGIDFNKDDIEIQVGLLFKEQIVELPFEKAIELLYFEQIERHISSFERMDDFLITKYSLERVKPHVVEIIENECCSDDIKASAIRTSIKHKIGEVKEEIYELLQNKNFYKKEICFEYLRTLEFNRNQLLQFLVKNPKICEDWHLELVNYLLDDNTTHNQLIEIIDEQANFDPQIGPYDYLPSAISTFGLRLGSYKCMVVFFQYVTAKKYYRSNLRYSYFEAAETYYPNELFKLALNTLEIYREHIADHSGESICGIMYSIITNLASQNIERYHEAMTFYDRLVNDYGHQNPNIHALEWWKIRLTKTFQERKSQYLSEKEAIKIMEM